MVHFSTVALAPLLSQRDVQLANGVRLHYAQQGPGAGPAVVLLHGFSDSSFSFSRIMPLLPEWVRVIAPDLRGHGHSDRPKSGYRIADLANDVVQLMDALNVPSAIVVGHSMGSFVAQAVAERAPRRVLKQVLIGSAPVASNAVVAQLRSEIEGLSDPPDEDFVRAFQYGTVALPVPDAFMEAAIANSRRMPARVWKAALRGLLEFRPARPRPAIPTLVIGGMEDRVFSVAEQSAVAREFAHAELHLVRGVGHAIHWEQPDLFVDRLVRFIPS